MNSSSQDKCEHIKANTLSLFTLYTCLLMLLSFMTIPVLAETNKSKATFKKEPIMKLRGEIRGNTEQPKVIFILPWQTPEASQPPTFKLQENITDTYLEPIDRAEFIRQNRGLNRMKNNTEIP